MSWRIHHVGHAVKALDVSLRFYTEFVGGRIVDRERLPAHGVEVAFVALNIGGACESPLIELLSPLAEQALAPENTLARFLQKRGEGLHHIAYEVDDIRAELARLSAAGIQLIDKQPRPGGLGMEVAFLHPRSADGVLVELCSKPAD